MLDYQPMRPDIIWQMVLDHYPDGVDVNHVMMNEVPENIGEITVSETVDNPTEEDKNHLIGPRLVTIDIQLFEVEPETAIYAGMSPITHRVYVFVDTKNHA